MIRIAILHHHPFSYGGIIDGFSGHEKVANAVKGNCEILLFGHKHNPHFRVDKNQVDLITCSRKTTNYVSVKSFAITRITIRDPGSQYFAIGVQQEYLHYHCLVTDGVFAPSACDEAEFFEAARMGEALIEGLTEKLRRRILRYMVRRELIDEHTALDMAGWDHHGGFSLDASVRVDKEDRMALERRVRTCARPPFAEGRPCLAEPNTVVYTLTKPDRNGRRALSLTPLERIERLAALIPPPRVHRHRYAGVLAPNSSLRTRVDCLRCARCRPGRKAR